MAKARDRTTVDQCFETNPSISRDFVNTRVFVNNNIKSNFSHQSTMLNQVKQAPQINEKEVFMKILKLYGGVVSLDEIHLNILKDYFVQGVDILDWLQKQKCNFTIFVNEFYRGNSVVVLYQSGLRLCIKYLAEKGCSNETCKYLHLCRQYIMNKCTYQACRYCHDVRSDHNARLISEQGRDGLLMKLSMGEQITVIRCSNPNLCESYNNGVCTNGEDECCPHIHMCKDYILRRCKNTSCDKNHDIKKCKDTLRMYRIRTFHEDVVLRMILFATTLPRFISGKSDKEKSEVKQKWVARGHDIRSSNSVAEGGDFLQHTHDMPTISTMKSVADFLEHCCDVRADKAINVEGSLHGNFGDEHSAFPERKNSEVLLASLCDPNRLFSIILKQSGGMIVVGACSCLEYLEKLPFEEVPVREFFRQNSNLFRYFEDSRWTESRVCVCRRGFILCSDFQSKRGCSREECKAIHICKDFLSGFCADPLCSNTFETRHNKKIVNELGLNIFEESELIVLLQCSCLRICQKYIDTSACADYDSGSCPHLHICDQYIRDCCLKPETECKLGHNLNDSRVQNTLRKYFYKLPNLIILKRIILIPKSAPKLPTPPVRKTLIRSRETYICEKQLAGNCDSGNDCEFHHCEAPYYWQVFSKGKWLHVKNIEKNYCIPRISQCTMSVDQVSCILSFDTMNLKDMDTGHTLPVRRLSTKPSVQSAPSSGFTTLWIWYWQDDDQTWIPFGLDNTGPQNDVIEMRYSQREIIPKMHFSINKCEYYLDLVKMIQRNRTTGKTRCVRRRPYYVSPNDVKTLTFPPAQEKHYDPQCLPKRWSYMDTKSSCRPKYEKVQLPSHHPEYENVKEKFKDSVSNGFLIKHIYRIQNPDLWKAYYRKTQEIKNKNGTSGCKILLLFHGTDKSTVEGICFQNFDPRMHGKNATAYGCGSYFASKADYSDKFTDQGNKRRYMFLAKVAVGRYTLGGSAYKRPPPVDPKNQHGELFDSCVNNTAHPTIFVVFEKDQCYPDYLIEYSESQPSATMRASARTSPAATLTPLQHAGSEPSTLPLPAGVRPSTTTSKTTKGTSVVSYNTSSSSASSITSATIPRAVRSTVSSHIRSQPSAFPNTSSSSTSRTTAVVIPGAARSTLSSENLLSTTVSSNVTVRSTSTASARYTSDSAYRTTPTASENNTTPTKCPSSDMLNVEYAPEERANVTPSVGLTTGVSDAKIQNNNDKSKCIIQ